jgi:hypothetical protein
MIRRLCIVVVAFSAFLALARAAEPTDEELRKKPITSDGGEIGKLLTQWWKDGTAAGNVGDWYDNRDGDHSPLDLRPWPQLRRFPYSADDVKARRHWAMATVVRPHVTFGNSSTSAPPEGGGSNVRNYYVHPRGLPFLAEQYTHNNVYIYPEHRDHDPGHSGVGDGYGDLYPTNTPYLITSQGSSGSDQPFMRAIPFTLAAFRPEVKKKLVESGLLMPTLQMILRGSNKHLSNPKEYLTGKAHPTVFEGSWVDPLKMVKMAHDIRADSIPPLVRLKVTSESKVEPGRDFFEPLGYSEQLGDSLSVIARIWRGKDHERRMVVSAEKSLDVNNKPLTFTWVVLRGDEKRIRITPKNKAGSVAEVVVGYHERRPIAPKSAMESNRVDIGVFAHNGSYHSAPAFITFYSLDCEGRTYDEKGRPVEIGYGMGETEWRLIDAGSLFATLSGDGPAARVMPLSREQRGDLEKCAKEVRPLQETLAKARKNREMLERNRNEEAVRVRVAEKKLAELTNAKKDKEAIQEQEKVLADHRSALKKAEALAQTAHKPVADAEAAVNRFLDTARPGLKSSPRAFALEQLRQSARKVDLWNKHAALREEHDKPGNAARRPAIEQARKKLVDLGIISGGKKGALVFRPARGGDSSERLTVYERAFVEHFHAVALANLVVPGVVQAVFHTNFVDQRLTTPKLWRDVYRPNQGWTRYADGKSFEFTAEGLLVTEKDEKGRVVKARTVIYRQKPHTGRWVNPNPLEHVPDEEITFEYDGETRKEKGRTKVRPGK